MAECFVDTMNLQKQEEYAKQKGYRDLCFAREILRLSPRSLSTSRAQGFLFNLLFAVPRENLNFTLADNKSAHGLIEGLVEVLQGFYDKHLADGMEVLFENIEERLPFRSGQDHHLKQEIAASYCALRTLTALSREVRNRARIFIRKDLLHLLASFLCHKHLHKTFVRAAVEALFVGIGILSIFKDGELSTRVLNALLHVLEKNTLSTAIIEDHVSDTEMAENLDLGTAETILSSLTSFSLDWGVESRTMKRFFDIIGKLLVVRNFVRALGVLSRIARILAFAYPQQAGRHLTFLSGIIQLLQNEDCLDNAVESIRIIHSVYPLSGYTEEFNIHCQRDNLSEAQKKTLSIIIAATKEDQQASKSPQQAYALRQPDEVVTENLGKRREHELDVNGEESFSVLDTVIHDPL